MGTASRSGLRQAGSAEVFEVRMGGRKPGCTEFTRMPCLANCTAADFVMVRTAPLEAL